MLDELVKSRKFTELDGLVKSAGGKASRIARNEAYLEVRRNDERFAQRSIRTFYETVMITRRTFLSLSLGVACGRSLLRPDAAPAASFPGFFFTQLRYGRGEWDPNPLFADAIIEELELRTSIEAAKERRIISASDPGLFFTPFLYMAGKEEFPSFTAQEREKLARYLSYGGFLFAEDTLGARGYGFDLSFRREMEKIMPDHELKRLPPDHSVYQSFYLINSPDGRRKINPFLEGVTLRDWSPVIYSQNDLSGAWSRDSHGQWVQECVPGGEQQRKTALKAGINIIVYSLTADYKKDLIHHPFIERRRKS